MAPKRARFGSKRPFWGPLRSSKGSGGLIWSQLPPIGPPELDSWSKHTLTRYRAPSGPQGALKGLDFAPKSPFGGPQGPRRAPMGQIWSQLHPRGLRRLNIGSRHFLA